jgi:hypothetical protein
MVSWARIDDHRRMTESHQIDTIVSRHHADESEDGRICRACGRPWPCDVARIASAFEAQRQGVSASVRRRTSRRSLPSRIALPA